MLQIPYRTINQPQLNNMICLEQELEMELPKVFLNLCFMGALQSTIQYKVVTKSEFRHSINLISLAIQIIFASLFISHFIGKRLPTASKMLEKVVFFLAATTFFFAMYITSPWVSRVLYRLSLSSPWSLLPSTIAFRRLYLVLKNNPTLRFVVLRVCYIICSSKMS